jgi:hypothetical protein
MWNRVSTTLGNRDTINHARFPHVQRSSPVRRGWRLGAGPELYGQGIAASIYGRGRRRVHHTLVCGYCGYIVSNTIDDRVTGIELRRKQTRLLEGREAALPIADPEGFGANHPAAHLVVRTCFARNEPHLGHPISQAFRNWIREGE